MCVTHGRNVLLVVSANLIQLGTRLPTHHNIWCNLPKPIGDTTKWPKTVIRGCPPATAVTLPPDPVPAHPTQTPAVNQFNAKS
ncbi:hypothetical protein MN608_04515 [Microdochium nivale]|nr:hypothetical protein MN608_04515 [Microdochium nivale]